MTAKSGKSKQEQFLDKLNSDAKFRNQFLDHPASTLKEFGFSLEPEDERKIVEIVDYLKDDVKHIFEIPSGYSNMMKKMGFGIKIPPRIVVEMEPEKIIPP